MTYLPVILFEALFIGSLIALYLVFRFAYKKAVLEAHRSRIFNHRNELYDMARDEIIAPSHPAYRHVETYLNRLLQFAHRTNTINMIFSYLMLKMGFLTINNDLHLSQSLSHLPDKEELDMDVRRKLIKIKRESFNEVIKFLPKYSPAWIMVWGFAFIYYMAKDSYLNKTKFDAQSIARDYEVERNMPGRGRRMEPAA